MEIQFSEVVQEKEERGGDNDYLYGYVKFDLRTSDGTEYKGLEEGFKMTVGGEVATAPIELWGRGTGSTVPVHHNSFQQAVQSYVRSVLTPTISSDSVARASMWNNNRFIVPWSTEIEDLPT